MTAVRLPFNGTVTEPRPAASSAAIKIAVAVVGGLGALGLAYLGSSLTSAVIVVVLLVGSVGAYVLFTNPQLLMPMAVFSMWVEALGVGPITVGRLIAALITVVVVARLLTSSWRLPAMRPRAWLPTTLLMIWAAAGAFYSRVFVGGWLQGFLILFLGFAYFLVFLIFIESPEQLSRVLTGWVWLGTLLALLSDFAHFVIGNERTSGLTGNPNGFAILLITGMPIIVVLARQLEGRAKWLMLMNIPIYLSALVATGSRMGIIMGAVIGGYMFTTWPGQSISKRLGTMALGGVGMIGVGFLFLVLNPDRFSLAALGSDRGAGRVDLWNAGVTMIQDHLLVGRGLGGYRLDIFSLLQRSNNADLNVIRQKDFLSSGSAEAHNLYLTVMIDLGLIGFILYFGVIAASFKNLWDRRKSEWLWWVWAFGGVLVALLAASLFGSQLNNKVQWAIVGLAASFYVRPRLTAPLDATSRLVGAGVGAGAMSVGSGNPGSSIERADESRANHRPNYGPARLDLRLRWPLRRVMACAAFAGAALGVFGVSILQPTKYSGEAMVIGFKLDDPKPGLGVEIIDSRLQSISSLARSEPFLAELALRAGVTDRSIDDLREMVTADRPTLSAVIRITVTDQDREVVKALADQAVTALGVIIDRSRDGAIVVLDEEGRDPFAGQSSDYQGPVYLDLFSGRAAITEISPSLPIAAIAGMFVGVLVMGSVAMFAAGTARITTEENLDQLLGMSRLARIPHVGWRRGHGADQAGGIVNGIDLLGEDARTISFIGDGIRRERAVWTLVGAAAMSTSTGRPVVIVDLDLRHRDISRRCGVNGRRLLRTAPAAGVVEALVDHRAAAPMLEAVQRKRLPRSLRCLMGQGSSVMVLGAGRLLGDDFLDEDAIAELVLQLREVGTVFLHLPEPPGLIGIQRPIEASDGVVQVLLDGWTRMDRAMSTASMIAVMGTPAGYMLLDNS